MSAGFARVLLMLSLPALAGLGGAGMMLATAQRERERLAARLTTLLPQAPPPSVFEPLAAVRTAPEAVVSPWTRLLAVFGCDYDRRAIYSLPWWLVLLLGCGIGRALAALCSTLLGPAALLVWPVAWVMLCRSVFAQFHAKRRDVMLKQFPDALALIVRCVRVGVPVSEGIAVVGREAPDPTGPEFRHLANEIAIGTALDAALHETAARTGLAEYRFFATALALQAKSGGGLSESLEMLADIIRKRVALRARGYALTSEGRTSTIVLCVMPFLIAGMLFVLNPPYIMVMVTEPAGRKMATIGVLLILTAVFIMRRMIRATLA